MTTVTISRSKPFRASNRDDDDARYQGALARNKQRTDVRIFLTQRALQSFIYLLINCRDPHTVRWLEEHFGFTNLEEYHGTGALDLTRFESWNTLLLDLLHRPNDTVIVAARRRGRGQGGWSKENPHLEERFVEFEIDIDPPSLVTRLLSVRQQIAQEWVADLETLVAVNELVLESYHKVQNQNRKDEECTSFPDEDGSITSDHAECFNIEDMIAPYSIDHPSKNKQFAFERKATEFLTNKMLEDEAKRGLPSSTLRKGSFDLLSLLATQEAVHTVLRQYMQQREEKLVSLEWLKKFYIERLEQCFDGHGKYGRADDFLQDLLLASPSVVTVDDTMELIDPQRIAEDVIRARTEVASLWKVIMEQQVPSDHMQLQKSILAVRMGQQEVTPQQRQPMASSDSKLSSGSIDIIGEFE